MPKLIIAVIHDDDASAVVTALHAADLRVTQLRSSGGFLKGRNATLMVGVEDDRVADAVDAIERNAQPRTQQVPLELLGGMDASWLPTTVTHGGATIFVLPVDEMRRT